ncbi:MAG: right-handed parallel beta-helix repeat-containing protein, partial [Candidatus Aminicenantes bacterium]
FPSEKAAYEFDGHAGRVTIAGNKAYVADKNNGLRIIDISMSNPTQIGFYSPLGYAVAVAVSGNYAYIAAAYYGLRVIDISDPSHPVEVGAYNSQGNAIGVSVVGRYAYVAVLCGSGVGAGLHVVDIADPSYPTRVGFAPRELGCFQDMVVVGEIAYIANEWGLDLIDISSPNNPTLAGYIELQQGKEWLATHGVDISGTLAYVVGNAGLFIVDVSNPNSPTLIGSFSDDCEELQDVAIDGTNAYVTHAGNDVKIIDVSNPSSPRHLGVYRGPNFPHRVIIVNSTAYVAFGSSGLHCVNVSDPLSPTLAFSYDTSGYTLASAVAGDYVYVADELGGLLILERERVQSEAGRSIWSKSTSAVSTMNEITPNQRQTLGFNRKIPLVQHKKRIIERPPPYYQIASQSITNFHGTATAKVVTSTANSGPGTLRECIENAISGDTITFDPAIFPPENSATIELQTHLPSIYCGNLTIDASEAGVILDGSQLQDGIGLYLSSSNNTIRGLQIVHFSVIGISLVEGSNNNIIGGDRTIGSGPIGRGNLISGNRNQVSIHGNNNTIVGNFIGTDITGQKAFSDAQEFHSHGVWISGGSYNRIGRTSPGERNIISANGGTGVCLVRTNDNVVEGNYIGTDVNGKADLGNKGSGVSLELGSFHNFIKDNLISGSNWSAIYLSDCGSSYNTIIGNLIGPDSSGMEALGNLNVGVYIWIGGGNFNRIGRTSQEDRNIISGNPTGISLHGREAGNIITGNFIGTNISGASAISNAEGIWVAYNGSRNFIGGTTPAERNVISGNDTRGIRVEGTRHNFITGNYIGTDASGITPLWNGDSGIDIFSSSKNIVITENLISGSIGIRIDGADNVIKRNTLTQSTTGLNVKGDYNSIYYNKFLQNQTQASSDSSSNNWDRNGAGNYWSDYTGSDADGDGIGDISYSIPDNGTDHYPLISDLNRLTVQINPSGSGSVTIIPNKSNYKFGENVRLEAIPSGDKPFYFWSGGCPLGHENDNPLTVRMDSDRIITANFIQQYTLTIEAGSGGTTNPIPGTYTHDEGTSATITATPNSGYTFSNWTGDVSSTSNPITFTMDSNKSIKANFTKTSTGDTDEGGGGCFIATACFGTPMAEEVKVLSAFRDRYLLTNPEGRILVRLYYKFSPGIAGFIRDKKYLRSLIRDCLEPIVYIIGLFAKKTIESKP